MVSTYKHFKKHEEILFGLSFFTLIKIGLLTLLLAIVTINLKLSLNSPLFLFFAIIWMIVSAFIVKASAGDEVRGFYSSFLAHPFKNHIFPNFSDKEKVGPVVVKELPEWIRSKNPFTVALQNYQEELDLSALNKYSTKEGYKSLSELQDIKKIEDEIVITKEGDFLAFVKLDNGIQWSNLSQDERVRAIENWGRFLSQLQSISPMNSYFSVGSQLGDSVQAFTWARQFKVDDLAKGLTKINEKHEPNAAEIVSNTYLNEWYKKVFCGELFIPDLDFFLIIRHKRSKTKIHPVYKYARKLFPGWLSADLSLITEEEYEEELNFLKQKIDVAQSTLLSMDIKSKQLKNNELRDLCDQFMPISSALERAKEGDLMNIGSRFKEPLEDNSKYLKYQGKFYKTYRVHMPPEDGDLNAWLLNYFSMLETESYISVQWTPRDAHSDRRHAERKADIMMQLAKSSKSSTAAIIKENKAISDELVNEPHSFDLIIYLTIVCDDLEKLQKIDNRIRRPVKSAVLSPLDRQQVRNWLYSLPFAFNKLSDEEKLFATKNFAQSCLPFFKTEIGTKRGPLLGLSLDDMRPVFLDEYDRTVCNNRGINFIGDSGSGKTVSAKLAVKRRLERGGSFIIVDNTQDGWQFFLDFYGGSVVDIDTSISPDGKPFFAPFKLPENYNRNELNAQIERVAKLLTVIKERSSMIDAFEEVFLLKSLQELYDTVKKPILSDLYQLWKSEKTKLREEYAEKYFKEWSELIAPYCTCTNGIYSGLMDGNEPRISDDARLILFTFAKIDSNSNFLPVSLCLVSNYVSQRVVFKKETGVSFIIDEAWKMFSGRNSAKGKELLNYFARAGRGMDLGLWTISQKPQDLPREIHSSASATLCFQLKEMGDRRDMAQMANLTEPERMHLESPEMSESGTCILKTTRSSGSLRVLLDPLEEVLCNSTRDFVNKRNRIFEENLEDCRMTAAIITVERLLKEMMDGANES